MSVALLRGTLLLPSPQPASPPTCIPTHLHPPLPHPRRLLISIPLSYSGGILAAKQEIRQYPTRTNQVGVGKKLACRPCVSED